MIRTGISELQKKKVFTAVNKINILRYAQHYTSKPSH